MITKTLMALLVIGLSISFSFGQDKEIFLKDYDPVSLYEIPKTFPVKAKFPVIDMHSKPYAKSESEIEEWINTMDRAGIEKTILLTFRPEQLLIVFMTCTQNMEIVLKYGVELIIQDTISPVELIGQQKNWFAAITKVHEVLVSGETKEKDYPLLNQMGLKECTSMTIGWFLSSEGVGNWECL